MRVRAYPAAFLLIQIVGEIIKMIVSEINDNFVIQSKIGHGTREGNLYSLTYFHK